MRTRKAIVIGVAVLALALMWVPSASADLMVGSIGVSGTFAWVHAADCTILGCAGPFAVVNADAIDFRTSALTPSPGTPGTATVLVALGDFASITSGTIHDFYYGPGTSPNSDFPNMPIDSTSTPAFFEVFGGGLTVDLLSLTSISATGSGSTAQLTMTGTVMFHKDGFDDTLGSFNFQSGQSGQALTFASQQSTVPEPTSVILLGLGLTGLVLGRRLKK
jgi:hypothetical protein